MLVVLLADGLLHGIITVMITMSLPASCPPQNVFFSGCKQEAAVTLVGRLLHGEPLVPNDCACMSSSSVRDSNRTSIL